MAGEIIQHPAAQPQHNRAHMLPTSMDEAVRMSAAIAKSGLFGCKTTEQAFSLMLLADAEGLHPAAAARDYHIMNGKPSLKADAMLGRYQSAGGKIEWVIREDECVEAIFTHPSSGSVTIRWDKARAQKANLWGKNNWVTYPRQMLAARVISEGVRASFPSIVAGVYTPEEVQDFGDEAPRDMKPIPQQEPEPEQEIQPSSRDQALEQERINANRYADAIIKKMNACTTATDFLKLVNDESRILAALEKQQPKIHKRVELVRLARVSDLHQPEQAAAE